MNPRTKDLLLTTLTIAAMTALLALAYAFRREGRLFWPLLLLAVPNLLVFIFGAPFVPSPAGAVRKMLAAAALKPGEIVFDIGCGDGRLARLAAKDYGARATGLELSPLVYLLARVVGLLRPSGAEIKLADFRWQDLSRADAVFCYLNKDIMTPLEAKLRKDLKPGARVVSYIYRLPSWREARVESFNGSPIWIYEKE